MAKRRRISYAQKQLPFDGTGNRLIQEPLKREWQLVTAAGVALIVAALFYGYTVVNSIAQVSLRESALKESRTLAAEIATQEGVYFEKTRGITLQYARQSGYQEPDDRVFVTRQWALSYAPDAR